MSYRIEKIDLGFREKIHYAIVNGLVTDFVRGYSWGVEFKLDDKDVKKIRCVGSYPPIIPGDRVCAAIPLTQTYITAWPLDGSTIVRPAKEKPDEREAIEMMTLTRDGKLIGLYSVQHEFTQAIIGMKVNDKYLDELLEEILLGVR